jgi:peptidoglycan lytic transglycosylase
MALFAANRAGNHKIMIYPRFRHAAVCAAVLLGLSACAQSAPSVSARPGGDQVSWRTTPGAPVTGTTGVYKVGAPYQIAGTWYYPKEDFDYRETGIASWYGPGFNGRVTANGEVYDQDALTAAHRTLPMPSIVRVTNLDTGRSIKVRINDRGPFARSRIIDLTRRGAELLGFVREGTAKVLVEIVDDETRRIASTALAGEAAKDAPDAVPMVAVTAEPLPGSVTPTLADNPAASQTAYAAPNRSTAAPNYSGTASTAALSRPLGSSEIYVQAGAFTNFNNANRLRALLSQLGNVRIASALVEDTQFFRVQLGPVATVESADRLLELLLANGHTSATVVVD